MNYEDTAVMWMFIKTGYCHKNLLHPTAEIDFDLTVNTVISQQPFLIEVNLSSTKFLFIFFKS